LFFKYVIYLTLHYVKQCVYINFSCIYVWLLNLLGIYIWYTLHFCYFVPQNPARTYHYNISLIIYFFCSSHSPCPKIYLVFMVFPDKKRIRLVSLSYLPHMPLDLYICLLLLVYSPIKLVKQLILYIWFSLNTWWSCIQIWRLIFLSIRTNSRGWLSMLKDDINSYVWH
jgi:hypothetical protein